MLIAAIIPFRGNPEICRWTLEGFAKQELPPDAMLEVRVCGDGMEPPTLSPEILVHAKQNRITFAFRTIPHSGVSDAKNILLKDWPADIVVIANSDTRPDKNMVAAHVARLATLPPGSMVLGSAPYEPAADPTIFDAFIEQTPAIFFYHQLQPNQSYGYRQCWTLNLSARYADLAKINFFDSRFRPYAHEDLDIGFRSMGPSATNIYYDPTPHVTHRHPMTLDQYLDREELLGIMAPVLHDNNPALFHALLGPHSLEEAEKIFIPWTHMDRIVHAHTYARLMEWFAQPAANLTPNLLPTLYQLHIPLKRFAFRLGFLKGLTLRADADWQKRTPESLWKKALPPLPSN